jgi:hypothetical protein
MTPIRTRWFAGLSLAALAACKPDLGDPASLVTEPRLLAVRSDPAEVLPDHPVTYQALLANPEGSSTPDVAWGFCADPAPLSSNNVANDGCVYGASSLPVRGPEIQTTIPIGACSVFGPTPPAPQPGQPQRRPHDADVTGGYYQPIRALATIKNAPPLSPAIGLTRITCDLPNVSIDIVKDFHNRYHANQNPTLAGVVALLPGDSAAHAMTEPVPAQTPVTLRASWTDDSAESYPVFDPQSRTLVDHREAIRVSWFVSDGALASDRTGRGEDDTETFADDVWTTPGPGPAQLWVVVRDSRGGVAFAGYAITIAP